MEHDEAASNALSRQEIESQMQGLSLQDILADLASRFVINVPPEELQDMSRVYFGIEEAHWFYEDFIRPVRRDLPSFTLPKFGERIIAACAPHAVFTCDPIASYKQFIAYKTSVPVRGAILLNPSRDKVLLVKGWKSGASWGFPRGKINQGETDRDCAVRECWEEIGYDISPHFDPSVYPHSQNAHDAPPPLFNVQAMDEAKQDFIDVMHAEQQMRFYIVFDVPEHTVFETRTRKEISDIRWHPLKKLPGWQKGGGGANAKGKYYGVAPVLRQLRIKLSPGPNNHHTDTASKEYTTASEDETTLEEGTRALQKLFLADPPYAAATSALPTETSSAGAASFFGERSSAGQPESTTSDAEEHQRQQRRKALLRSLDDMLTTESHQASAANSPTGSSGYYSPSSRGRSTTLDHDAAAVSAAALNGPGLLATLFATADKAAKDQHQQRKHSVGSVAHTQPHHSPYQQSSPRAPHQYPSPSKLYSPQPQHQSPLAMFQPAQALLSMPPPSQPGMTPQHQDPLPPSLAYQPAQHHFFTPDLPPSMQPLQHQQPVAPFSQPGAPPSMPQFPPAPALQPVALRPIPLLTNFQSPSPVMPQAAQQGALPPIDAQQQASLLNLLNGGARNTAASTTSSSNNLNSIQSWNQPNYPTGSPIAPHIGQQVRPLFAS